VRGRHRTPALPQRKHAKRFLRSPRDRLVRIGREAREIRFDGRVADITEQREDCGHVASLCQGPLKQRYGGDATLRQHDSRDRAGIFVGFAEPREQAPAGRFAISSQRYERCCSPSPAVDLVLVVTPSGALVWERQSRGWAKPSRPCSASLGVYRYP